MIDKYIQKRVLRSLAGVEIIMRPWTNQECLNYKYLKRHRYLKRVQSTRTVGGETYTVHEIRPSDKVKFR